jgi:16S rRNA (guanine527-N7)-methyltransferase
MRRGRMRQSTGARMTRAELADAGIAVGEAEHARLARFVEALLRENERINLVGTRDPRAFWENHVCDSLALLPCLDAQQSRRVLDLGSGGGLPGVPLACARPACHVTLLDATRKKLLAVERACREAGLDHVAFHWARAEQAAHDPALRNSFDAVTCRAVGPVAVLLELGAPFLRGGGVLLLFKSVSGAEAEMAQASAAAGRCGMRLSGTHRYELPGGRGPRILAIYEKRS